MIASLMKMEDMSLQHWLKEAVLPLKWTEKVINAPLLYSPDRQRFEAQIVWLPNFLDEGRGWVYFDLIDTENCVFTSIPITEQNGLITVYNENGAVISGTNYVINYNDGAIIASGGITTPQGIPTTVDFTQHYVSLIDGWPGTEPPEAPVVAVQTEHFDKRPFQLGGGRKSVRYYTLHIFATSSAERDDLTEFLYDALYNRHIPVLDYRKGEPLNYDGTFNLAYAGDLLKLNNNDDALFYFREVRSEYINVRQDWSDLNRWRSKITFIMESYRDGLDFNAL